MHIAKKRTWACVAATLLVSAAGCATRGFVRDEMAGLKAEMGLAGTDLHSGLDDARSAANRAETSAAAAALVSESARLMALGRVGYREVERYRVYFPPDGTEPEPGADGALNRAVEEIGAHPEYLVEIYGYTDAKGSESYNLELARKRAESIRRRLAVRAPGQLSRFHALGFGENVPLGAAATFDDGAHRRQAVIVLVERTAPGVSPTPIAERREGPR